MDDEVLDVVKENDLDAFEAEKLQEIVDETGLDPEEAIDFL